MSSRVFGRGHYRESFAFALPTLSLQSGVVGQTVPNSLQNKTQSDKQARRKSAV
jgi:hypothetical protein